MTENIKGRPIRRVVTGHNAAGQSVIMEDQASPFALAMPNVPGLVVTDLWKTFDTPADNSSTSEPCTKQITLTPPSGGSVLRVVQFPPDSGYMDTWDAHTSFSAMGSAVSLDHSADSKAGMHRTHSVDYALVMSGEIWALMDADETLLQAGDVLVQRGTNHGWSNRSNEPALVAFVLIDAKPVAMPDRI